MDCKHCHHERGIWVQMKPGKAIEQTWVCGIPDFPGQTVGVTMSPGGPGKLIDVMKCPECGYSVKYGYSVEDEHERP